MSFDFEKRRRQIELHPLAIFCDLSNRLFTRLGLRLRFSTCVYYLAHGNVTCGGLSLHEAYGETGPVGWEIRVPLL